LKPTLEKIINNLVASFTGADHDFYKREFKFFNDVTAISGYLKEYIRYGQNEKKPMQKVKQFIIFINMLTNSPMNNRNVWMKS
jgi:hypothetical protein